MTGTTRIPKAELTGLYGYLVKRFSRKVLGAVAAPAEVMGHNKRVLKDTMAIGGKVQKWHELDPNRNRSPTWSWRRWSDARGASTSTTSTPTTGVLPLTSRDRVRGLSDHIGQGCWPS